MRTHWGGRGQNAVGTAKSSLRAYLIDSKGMSARVVGCRCGVDLIDFTGLVIFSSYISRNTGDSSICLPGGLEFEVFSRNHLRRNRIFAAIGL
jgi:hypothetical protein